MPSSRAGGVAIQGPQDCFKRSLDRHASLAMTPAVPEPVALGDVNPRQDGEV